jgi:1-hydroxy-2-methyl-2-(E)-butenyl 4-diphosphate synthase
LLKPELRERHIQSPIAVRVERASSPFVSSDGTGGTPALLEVAEKINVPYTGKEDVTGLLADAAKLTVQFDVEGESPELFVNNCATLAGVLNMFPKNQVILAVGQVDGLDVIGAYRVLAARFDNRRLVLPILLRDRIDRTGRDACATNSLIAASTHIGSLLCDGIGDAVEVTGEEDLLRSVKLAYNILQAAGARTFKTDYVACPSCGRTLFNLQTVTAKIKSRTSHLKGVKIAVMGCIVNGPGEMADADFGYVGTAPGRISLWVGKMQVKQHIPEEQAVDELVKLIKEHGKWIDPPPSLEAEAKEAALSAS